MKVFFVLQMIEPMSRHQTMCQTEKNPKPKATS